MYGMAKWVMHWHSCKDTCDDIMTELPKNNSVFQHRHYTQVAYIIKKKYTQLFWKTAVNLAGGNIRVAGGYVLSIYLFHFSQPSNVWWNRRSLPGKKYTGTQNLCVTWIIRISISPSSPLFFTGGQKSAKFCPVFCTPFALWRLWHKKAQKIKKKSKTTVYSADVWALIWCRPHAAQIPQLWDPFAQLGPLKCNN